CCAARRPPATASPRNQALRRYPEPRPRHCLLIARAPSPFPINQRLYAGIYHRQLTIASLRRRCRALVEVVQARHLGDKIEAYAMLHSAEVLADGWASGSAPVASHEC